MRSSRQAPVNRFVPGGVIGIFTFISQTGQAALLLMTSHQDFDNLATATLMNAKASNGKYGNANKNRKTENAK